MHRNIEHQADIAIEIEAHDRAGLFRSGLEAVIELLTGSKKTLLNGVSTESDQFDLTASGYDDEERLIDLLNKLLFACQVEDWWPFGVIDLQLQKDGSVYACVKGIHNHGKTLFREIKAATYHNLMIETVPMWKVKVVLDV